MKKQNFIITSLFLFWVIGTTTAQTYGAQNETYIED